MMVILLRSISVYRLSRADVDEADSEFNGFICPSDRCGRVFSEPVWLTDLSQGPHKETYYACPFCFSRLKIDEILRDSERSGRKSHIEMEFSDSKGKRIGKLSEEKRVTVYECPHQFGYLKSRSKGSEIPDNCLTCPRILQCMAST